LPGNIPSGSVHDCAEKCEQNGQCRSFEWNPDNIPTLCNLNVGECETGLHYRDDTECHKTCPAGYHLSTDCPGSGTGLPGNQRVTNIAGCRDMCDSRVQCDSFEYNNGLCNLNVAGCADGGLNPGWVNCAKGAVGTVVPSVAMSEGSPPQGSIVKGAPAGIVFLAAAVTLTFSVGLIAGAARRSKQPDQSPYSHLLDAA